MDPDSRPAKREFKDNVRLVALTALLLAVVPLVSTYLIGKSESFQPDFLARVFLYGFTLVNLTILVVLVFILARNLIKLFLERRRAVHGAKFKTKLVLIFVAFALLPSALIMFVGSGIISTAVERWFSHPVQSVLLGSQEVIESYYLEKQENATFYARRLSREVSDQRLLTPTRLSRLRRTMEARLTQYRLDLINVIGMEQKLLTLARPGLPQYYPDSTIRLAEVGLKGEERLQQESLGEGTLVQYVSPVHTIGTHEVEGAVVVSYFIPKSLTSTLELVNQSANLYQQAEAQKEPIQDLYLSFFVMVSLLVLFSSTWIGLYLAKRITVPIGQLAEATERIMAGDLDHPVSGAAVDDLDLLMSSFNRMTAQLKLSQERLETSREDLEIKNVELDRRRRYIETVLENITTGIVSFDGKGTLTGANQASIKMLKLDDRTTGGHYRDVFNEEALAPLKQLLDRALEETVTPLEQEVDLQLEDRELHLAVYLTMLQGAIDEQPGLLMVLDDLTQLLRAQKVAAWREVARRLAHEIKNPLTPIQLSAQRIRKHFRSQSEDIARVVEEGTVTIIEEVDSLKTLVDEFSQFARMPQVAAEAQLLPPILQTTLELYEGLFKELTIATDFPDNVPKVRVDPELIRRVLINIIDNAIEATGGKGTVLVSTAYEPGREVALIEISDDGPGVTPEERDKLFLPYYSTKRRGSGLGLAIVHRIIAEHHGRVYVKDNNPCGTRFVIELPVETVGVESNITATVPNIGEA